MDKIIGELFGEMFSMMFPITSAIIKFKLWIPILITIGACIVGAIYGVFRLFSWIF